LLLYNFVTFTLDPFWSKTHGEANTLPSPRPWELPMDYGIVFILALVGAVLVIRQLLMVHGATPLRGPPPQGGRGQSVPSPPTEEGEGGGALPLVAPGVLLAWLGTGLLWMYIPLAYQHRLAF